MGSEEAYRLAIQACRETWNEKTVGQIEQALKQKASEDAISRQAALGCCRNEWEEEVEMRLKSLPSVTSQQKYEDIAKAFQFGLAFGFGEKYDEMDKVIDEIKKVITPLDKYKVESEEV